jgi:methylated-DNA-[protein]-cysteine S-methyltransferase
MEARMNVYSSTVDSPAGAFTIIGDADGRVLASGWTADVDALLALVHPTLRRAPQPRADLGAATKAALAYFDGDLAAPDAVEVRWRTTEFLGQAWDALRAVAPGEPISYTEFAARAGRPGAVRAAAQACARNAAALFVPCHRVVRTDGSLGGFRYGLPAKQWLLTHEAARSGERG